MSYLIWYINVYIAVPISITDNWDTFDNFVIYAAHMLAGGCVLDVRRCATIDGWPYLYVT